MWCCMVAWGLSRCARASGSQHLPVFYGYFNKQHPSRARSLCVYVCMYVHVCMCASVYVCMHAWIYVWMDMEEAAAARFHSRMQGALPERFSGDLRLLRL